MYPTKRCEATQRNEPSNRWWCSLEILGDLHGTLVWYIMGVVNFFVQMNPDVLAAYRESERAIVEGRPAWATGVFALAVFGGAIGCILLLLRKSAAYYLFIIGESYLIKSRSLQVLLDTLPQVGRVEWIGIRPSRAEPMIALETVQINLEKGLDGDRFSGSSGNPRQVTLIQQEHLNVIADCLNRETIPPSLLRRNIVVSGINLLALKDKVFRIGDAMLEFSGLCHPCSKMEHHLGAGGYNAMRGHGGITARVCKAGLVRLNDMVSYQQNSVEKISIQ